MKYCMTQLPKMNTFTHCKQTSNAIKSCFNYRIFYLLHENLFLKNVNNKTLLDQAISNHLSYSWMINKQTQAASSSMTWQQHLKDWHFWKGTCKSPEILSKTHNNFRHYWNIQSLYNQQNQTPPHQTGSMFGLWNDKSFQH